MRIRLTVLIFLCLSCLCACNVKTQNDYQQYLRNNSGAVSFAAVGGDFRYCFTERTWSHRKEVKTWMGGILSTWVVEMGPMLEATMQTGDVRGVFRSLQPFTPGAKSVWVSEYDLASYDFINNRAKIRLAVRTIAPDGRASSKEYYAEGTPQLGKMYWGKSFAIKNAIQQSTKIAMDAILAEYFADLGQMGVR